MNETLRTSYAERLKTAAAARKAMLEKFQPKAAVQADQPVDRAARQAAELALVRQARTEAKVAKAQAALQAAQSAREAEAAIAAAALEEKRGARKERKALTKAEAKAKRDARYAARKARN
jgi:hypothetical protein